MRQRQAMQVEIVSLGILGTSSGSDQSARHAQRRQQSLAELGRHVGLQSDEILRGCGEVGLPQQAVVANVDRLQGDQQVVALLQEVSVSTVATVQLAADFLGIDIVASNFRVSEEGRTSRVRV